MEDNSRVRRVSRADQTAMPLKKIILEGSCNNARQRIMFDLFQVLHEPPYSAGH
jgi:hypothetical protein